ncbi:MAG: EAL domain-containing protein, partial [Acidobacteria bacterium]|nr:EAL domain-containing protein [Candidatus Sulfomarinibacter sp. MAG AM2]
AVLFSAYTIAKELQLRASTRELMDERVLAAALTNSLREANVVIDSGKEVNLRLDLEQVLETILACSLDLLDGQGSSIMMMCSEDELRTVCSKGQSSAGGARVNLRSGVAGQVAATHEAVLVNGTFDWSHYRDDHEEYRPTSALSIPLTSDGDLIGVLNVNAKPDREYSQRDLRAMSRFGEQAGSAIAHVQAHEAQRKFAHPTDYQALHNPLTGLPNRSLLLDRVGNALARRRPPGNSVVLLFLDLDDFKRVNDSLGHSAGDQVLIAFAERLRMSVRAGDSVAHFGADEFAILLEASDADEAKLAAERILSDLSKPFPLEDREVRFTASIGIALEPSSDGRPEELMRNAFTALHAAKERGKGQVAVFEQSMHSTALSRLDLEHELRHAVEHDGLDVYFQPLLDLKNLTVHGFEALVRWNHPERGVIAAFSFVPLAEEAGLQPQIDRMVLQETCARVKELNSGIFAANPVAAHVNLSPNTIREPDFVANLASDLEGSGLDPEQLVLEITEGVMMHDVEQAASRLRAIKSLGVRLALDDFGTGYSSLSYLRSFPVDVVKIDKIFVDEIEHDPGAVALVQAILSLGLGLTFEVVAEGIETSEQLDSLLDLGCRYGQGYLLARPLSEPQLVEFLDHICPGQ